MSVPNVLLLTGVPPGRGGIGGIFLSDLCLHYPKEHICCFAICNDYNPLLQELIWLPIVYKPRPRDYGFQKLGRQIARLSNPFVWRYVKSQMSDLLDQAVEFGKQHNVDLVWATLAFPAPIYLAKRVADALNAKLVTLIWDPPEYFLSEVGELDEFFCHSIMHEFHDTMRAAIRCGVASEGMRDEYQKRYGIESIVLIHGIHPDNWRVPKKLTESKQFVIGFSGSLYAKREWKALLSALSSLDWRINGRDVIVRYIGSAFDIRTKDKMQIEYLGFRSVEENIDLLSEVDVAYIPYWLDEPHRFVVRQGFPNKLPPYLAAGVPVLLHGPEDSSIGRFFRQYPVGLCCDSLEQSDIIDCLQKFATDKEFYSSCTEAGHLAMQKEFDLRIFLQRFAELIGIEESKLIL